MKKIILTLAISIASLPLAFAAEGELNDEMKNLCSALQSQSYQSRKELGKELRKIWTNKKDIEDFHGKAFTFLDGNENFSTFHNNQNLLAEIDPNQASPITVDKSKEYLVNGTEGRGTLKDHFVKAFDTKESLQSFIAHFAYNEDWHALKAPYAEKLNSQLFLAIIDHWKQSFERVESYKTVMNRFKDDLKHGNSYNAVEGDYKSLKSRHRNFLEEKVSKPESVWIKESIDDFLGRSAMLYTSNAFFNEVQEFWQAVVKEIDAQSAQ